MQNKRPEDELNPTRDPVELLGVLVELPREELHSARTALRKLLTHPDTDVRVHAFRRLLVHLGDVDAHADAVHAIGHDPEPKVRRTAAFAIASTSSENTRQEDVAALLHTLLDESERIRVRGAAYEALLLIFGRKDFPPVKQEIDLARDVDWQW